MTWLWDGSGLTELLWHVGPTNKSVAWQGNHVPGCMFYVPTLVLTLCIENTNRRSSNFNLFLAEQKETALFNSWFNLLAQKLSFPLCICHRRREGHSERTVTHYRCLCHTQGISNLGHRTMRSCLNCLSYQSPLAVTLYLGHLSTGLLRQTLPQSPQHRHKKRYVTMATLYQRNCLSWIHATVDRINSFIVLLYLSSY